MSGGPTPTSAHVDAGGVRLHYLDWGNRGAPAMLLLHGLQDCARSWDFFAERPCGTIITS